MKRLNNNVLLTALGVIMLFLAILIVAVIKGMVSQTAYTVLFIIGLVPALVLAFVFSLRYQAERQAEVREKRKANDFHPNKVKVLRTLEGTICEAVTVLLLVGALIAGIVNHVFAEWSTPPALNIIIFAAASVLLLVYAYHPANYLFRRTSEITNPRQMVTVVRFNRVMAIELALITFFMALFSTQESVQSLLILIMVVVLVITSCVFLFRFYNAE